MGLEGYVYREGAGVGRGACEGAVGIGFEEGGQVGVSEAGIVEAGHSELGWVVGVEKGGGGQGRAEVVGILRGV